jgi:hypothetical protein
MKSYKTGTGHVLELTRLKPEELAGAIPPDMWAQHERVEVEAQRWFDAVRRARQGGMRVVS